MGAVNSIADFAGKAGHVVQKLLGKVIEGAKRVYENPISAIGFCVTGISTAVMMAPAAAVGTLGFGGLGPVAGTFAAMAQASIGNVVPGSLFAILQSAGMGGAGTMAVQTLAATTGVGSAIVALKGKKRNGKET